MATSGTITLNVNQRKAISAINISVGNYPVSIDLHFTGVVTVTGAEATLICESYVNRTRVNTQSVVPKANGKFDQNITFNLSIMPNYPNSQLIVYLTYQVSETLTGLLKNITPARQVILPYPLPSYVNNIPGWILYCEASDLVQKSFVYTVTPPSYPATAGIDFEIEVVGA